MDKTQAYQRMLREIVRDHGEPRSFAPNAVTISNAQFGVALAQYPDVLPEAADEIAEAVRSCLSGNSSFAALFESSQEAIGYTLIAACRNRLLPTIRLDLQCMASDMEMEDRTDDEFARVTA